MGSPGGKQTKVLQQCRKIAVAQTGGKGTSCRVFFHASPFLSSSALFRTARCSLVPKIRPRGRWSCGTKSWAILFVRCWCGRIVLQQTSAVALRRQTLWPSEEMQGAGWFCSSACRTLLVSPASLPSPACTPLVWWCFSSNPQCSRTAFYVFTSLVRRGFTQDLIHPNIRKAGPAFSLLAVADWGHRSLCLWGVWNSPWCSHFESVLQVCFVCSSCHWLFP